MKVAGLGAPVSVQIRLQACEVDVIVDELRAQIDVYETTEAEARAGVTSDRPTTKPAATCSASFARCSVRSSATARCRPFP